MSIYSLRSSLRKTGRVWPSVRAAARAAELGRVPPSVRAVIASAEVDARYRQLQGQPSIYRRVGLQKSPLQRFGNGYGKEYGGSRIVARSGGADVFVTYRVNVQLQALYCHKKADDQTFGPRNEPYLVVSTFCPGNRGNMMTVKAGEYGAVDDGWFMPIGMQVATDATADDVMVIGALLENDEDSPERIEARIRELVMQAAATFVPAIEEYQLAEGWAGDILDVLTGWFVDLLGLGDDEIGPAAAFEIPFKTFTAYPDPPFPKVEEVRGLRYNYKLEHRGDGGHYASYYLVTVSKETTPQPL